MRIQNTQALTGHGNITGRAHMAQILEAGLAAADPYENTKKLIRLEGDTLYIGNPDFEPHKSLKTGIDAIDLNTIDRIFVVGAAKGIQRIGLAFEEVLGERLTGGHIIGKHGDAMECKKIGVTLAGHPVPDKYCVEGCKKIYEISKDITERDLVFTVVGNGVSSLLTWPSEGIDIDEVSDLTYMMQIEKGVTTEELNTIRNHVDRMKGGRFSRYFSKARLVHIVAIDITTANMPGLMRAEDDVLSKNIWLHSLSEGSTFADAVRVLKFWDAWDRTPKSIQDHLLKADPGDETVKKDEFLRMNYRLFGIMPKDKTIFKAAMEKARELGYNALYYSDWFRAEAKDAGKVMASVALNIERMGEPLKPPVAFFTGGEVIVTVGSEQGVGGRNQEYTLAGATIIKGSKKVVFGAVDTDGTDGPGGFEFEGAPECLAGGITDGYTMKEAAERGINVEAALKAHATSEALWKLDSGVHAEQNISVGDLGCVLIME
jgi:glycerate 2-kinase